MHYYIFQVTFLEIIDYDLEAFAYVKEWKEKLKLEMPYFEECNKVKLTMMDLEYF